MRHVQRNLCLRPLIAEGESIGWRRASRRCPPTPKSRNGTAGLDGEPAPSVAGGAHDSTRLGIRRRLLGDTSELRSQIRTNRRSRASYLDGPGRPPSVVAVLDNVHQQDRGRGMGTHRPLPPCLLPLPGGRNGAVWRQSAGVVCLRPRPIRGCVRSARLPDGRLAVDGSRPQPAPGSVGRSLSPAPQQAPSCSRGYTPGPESSLASAPRNCSGW